jgi:hypothetical protein
MEVACSLLSEMLVLEAAVPGQTGWLKIGLVTLRLAVYVTNQVGRTLGLDRRQGAHH